MFSKSKHSYTCGLHRFELQDAPEKDRRGVQCTCGADEENAKLQDSNIQPHANSDQNGGPSTSGASSSGALEFDNMDAKRPNSAKDISKTSSPLATGSSINPARSYSGPASRSLLTNNKQSNPPFSSDQVSQLRLALMSERELLSQSGSNSYLYKSSASATPSRVPSPIVHKVLTKEEEESLAASDCKAVNKLLAENYKLLKKLHNARECKDKLLREVSSLKESNEILENGLDTASEEMKKLRTKLPNPRFFCNFSVTKTYEDWVRSLEEQIRMDRKDYEETTHMLKLSSEREKALTKKVKQLEGTLVFCHDFSERVAFQHGFAEDVKVPEPEWRVQKDEDLSRKAICETVLEENAILRQQLKMATLERDEKDNELQKRTKKLIEAATQNDELKEDTYELSRRIQEYMLQMQDLKSCILDFYQE